ncbi:MAG TPA: acyl-CoA dehydrogenase family protein [Solirubrobacterales bacterium]|jgi:alkylation response protein AidB-like acyl-CoA dehydrogenase|nr:acyl-CoA dehydrogenase family protein [Solirubrobacterales bacterium]
MRRTHFTDEHRLFRESVAEFCRREVAPSLERWRAEKWIDRDLWLEAGRQDFLGLAMPAELGGSGLEDFRFNQILGEELAAMSVALNSSVMLGVDVVAPYLLELTSEAQRERYVPDFCAGRQVTAIGMTEPQAGSDLAALATRAVRDGDGWILNGTKTFITNGTGADLVVLAARTGEGRKDVSIFLVESGAEGFTRGRRLEKIGQHEADTAELFFEDVRLPAEALLGEQNRGFAYMMERLPQERLSVAVCNVANAASVLAETLEYVKERRAFGRAIGSFQNSRFTLAELDTELDVAQVYVDRCVEAHVAGELTAVDAAKAKWWTAEIQNKAIDACLQLHGGYGYMEEYRVGRAWADARVTKIYAGTNEIMKDLIGRSLGLG